MCQSHEWIIRFNLYNFTITSTSTLKIEKLEVRSLAQFREGKKKKKRRKPGFKIRSLWHQSQCFFFFLLHHAISQAYVVRPEKKKKTMEMEIMFKESMYGLFI